MPRRFPRTDVTLSWMDEPSLCDELSADRGSLEPAKRAPRGCFGEGSRIAQSARDVHVASSPQRAAALLAGVAGAQGWQRRQGQPREGEVWFRSAMSAATTALIRKSKARTASSFGKAKKRPNVRATRSVV